MLILAVSIGVLLAFRLPLVKYCARIGEIGGSDSQFHRWVFRLVKENKGHIRNLRNDTYLLDEARETGITYPLGFHKFLYHLGWTEEGLKRYGKYLATAWDTLLLILLFIAAMEFGEGVNWWFLILPLQFLFSVHRGRSYHFSERAFGVLMANLYLLGALGFYVQGFTWYWLLCSFAGFFLFASSSKFAYQATIFLSVLLSIALLTPFFVLHWLSHFMIVSVLTRGYAVTVFSGSVRYLTFYHKVLTHIFEHYTRPIFRDLVRLPFRFFKQPWRYTEEVWFRNPITLLVSGLPLNLAVLAMIIAEPTWDVWIIMWIIGIILVVFISLPTLRFLGEPERYMEHTLIALVVLLSRFTFSASSPLFAAVFILTIWGMIYTVRWRRLRYSERFAEVNHAEEEVSEFLVEESKKFVGRRVLLWTYVRASIRLVLDTDSYKVVGYLSGVEPKDWHRVKELFPQTHEAVNPDLEKITKEYSVDHIVIDKVLTKRTQNRLGITYYEKRPGTVIFENDFFEVLRVEGAIS